MDLAGTSGHCEKRARRREWNATCQAAAAWERHRLLLQQAENLGRAAQHESEQQTAARISLSLATAQPRLPSPTAHESMNVAIERRFRQAPSRIELQCEPERPL